MRWICYDENETFSIEAKNLEQAEKLASVYEAKVLCPSNCLHRHHVQAGNKVTDAHSSAHQK